jgi:hypothetical protein
VPVMFVFFAKREADESLATGALAAHPQGQ